MGYLEVTILRGGTQVAYGDIPASFGSVSLTGRQALKYQRRRRLSPALLGLAPLC
jgi:hypothetical protein